MQISKDTQAVVEYLDRFSNGTLRKKNDVATILEIAASNNASKMMNDLIFTSKSVWNLYMKIKKSSNATDGAQLLEREFNKSVVLMANLVDKFMDFGDDEVLERFQKVYLADTSGATKNLIDLAYDFSVLKNLQADMKAGE